MGRIFADKSRGRVPALCLVLLVSCSWPAFARAPVAVATIFPIADLMRGLAGSAVEVSVLLPAGASPHSFELRPAQARVVSDADLFVSIGGSFDHWAERFVSDRNTSVLKLLSSVGADGTSGNPHVWLDPVLVRDEVIPLLARALSRLVPEQGPAIAQRRERLAGELAALDKEIRLSLAQVSKRSFVAVHPTWDLFARRYGLREIVVQSAEGADPSAARVAGVIKMARKLGVDRLIVEAQSRSRVAAAIAEELGGETITVDPLGGPGVPGRDSYLALMQFNLRAFVRALQ